MTLSQYNEVEMKQKFFNQMHLKPVSAYPRITTGWASYRARVLSALEN